MITVGVIYEIIPDMECEHCNHQWPLVLENPKIDWGDKIEVRMAVEVRCPNCQKDAIIYRDKNYDDEFF